MIYRAALVGCGKIGSELADDARVRGIYSHAGAYAACPEIKLAAVCDSDPVKLQRCSERWHVPACYCDPMKMLAEQRPDIVSICTPDATHADLTRAALETPGVRAVLAEKPLATELQAARELVHLAAKRKVVLAVNYSRRYAQSHQKLRELLRSGAIGEIQTVGGYYTKGTLHNGTHWFDLARYLVGEVTRAWGADVRQERGDDPTLDAFLGFASGASAHLQGCDDSSFGIFEMDLIGTRGRVRLVESGHVVETYRVEDSPYCTGYRTLACSQRVAGGLQDVLLHAVEDVVHCLEEGCQPRCAGADGVAALEIAFAVRESARSGQIVTWQQN
jgi:predicted dehydrogenase